MRSRFLLITCTVAWLCCFLVGCGGDGFDRVPVSGTVTCQGIENPSGGLVATPAQAGTGAPNVSTIVTDGKFGFPADRGPVAGSYIFEFSLLDPTKGPPAVGGENPEDARETGPTIPFRKTVEIPEGGGDSLSIELTPADRVVGM
ncbi:MAG: hypothetical protein GXY83_01895 [Rhodopirellula sp.]|nr:hypothetical protein [Rhodopirellula sp.]